MGLWLMLFIWLTSSNSNASEKNLIFPRLPREIIINKEVWKIRYVKRLKMKNESLLGLTEYKKKLITICTNQPPEDIESTLIHEIIHASNSRLSEKDVLNLERNLYDSLRQIYLHQRDSK